MSLLRSFGDWASRNPTARALSAPGRRTLSYGELVGVVHRIADRITATGVSRPSVVGTMFPNGPEAAVAFLATISVTAAAPLNPDLSPADALEMVERLGIDVVLSLAGWTSPAAEAIRSSGRLVIAIDPADLDQPPVGTGSVDEFLGRTFPDAADSALVLTTSGTTSRPKVVPITQGNLAASADNIAAWLSLSPDDCSLNVMPLFHVHGLVAAVLATLVSGGEVVCAPGFDVARFFGWLDEHQPTWFTAVPTMHQAIAERARREGGVLSTRLRFMRSASSALPPTVADDMERLFGVPLVEAYGMTEGAHQIACNPLPPGDRRTGTVGLAAGPEVQVFDTGGAPVPPGAIGEIVIRGANVVSGYADPANNLDAFFDGWFRTGDQGVLSTDGYLTITGRLKEIINRGGEKVSPREVDEVLLGHPAVAQAVTFAVPDRRLGEQVGAAVVLRQPASERELRLHAAGLLSAFKVPRRILILEALPKGPTGKLQRIGLAGVLGLDDLDDREDGDEPIGHVAPHTPAQEFLAGLWTELLAVDGIGIHDRFLDIGGNSLAAAQLLARVADALGIEIPLIDLFDRPTIEAQAELIESILLSES